MTNFFTKMISRRVTRMTRRELEIQILRLNSIKVQLSPKASFSHVWLNQPFRHIIIILNYQISTVFSTFTYEQGWAVVPGFGGTNFRGTVPQGCPAGQAGPGQKIAGLSRPVPCPSLLMKEYIKIFIYKWYGKKIDCLVLQLGFWSWTQNLLLNFHSGI